MTSNAAYGPVDIETAKSGNSSSIGEPHVYEHVDGDDCGGGDGDGDSGDGGDDRVYEPMDHVVKPASQGGAVNKEDDDNTYEILDKEHPL